MNSDLTAAQVQEARTLLGWSRDRLSPLAGISTTYLAKFEQGIKTLEPSTVALIRAAFEEAGVEFFAENGGGAGVRMRKPK